jgi:signal transduction histidine kinase
MELEHIKHSAELIDSEPVNLIQVTQDVLHQLQPQLKDRQQTVRIYERTMLPIYTDERYVRQIVLNLIDNAGKYSEDGKPIEVRFRSDPNYQFVRVRDYGVGVNRREWGRLFQQFGQINQPLSANATSNGLGLYVCKQLSQVLGGELSLQSKHIGSCFVLQLPVMRQSSLWKASSW